MANGWVLGGVEPALHGVGGGKGLLATGVPEGIADFEYRIITWPTGGLSGVWSLPCMA